MYQKVAQDMRHDGNEKKTTTNKPTQKTVMYILVMVECHRGVVWSCFTHPISGTTVQPVNTEHSGVA